MKLEGCIVHQMSKHKLFSFWALYPRPLFSEGVPLSLNRGFSFGASFLHFKLKLWIRLCRK